MIFFFSETKYSKLKFWFIFLLFYLEWDYSGDIFLHCYYMDTINFWTYLLFFWIYFDPWIYELCHVSLRKVFFLILKSILR